MPRRPALFEGEAFPDQDVDAWLARRGVWRIAGVDEAGRGPLAGPVVAAAVILPPSHTIQGITDSKLVPASRRESLFAQICQGAEAFSIGVVGPARIDRVNILRASLEAMALALQQLFFADQAPGLILIDGRDAAMLPADCTNRPPVFPLIKGDRRSESVAAASILAKVARDRIMGELHLRYPAYGFARHKGYPTLAHREAVARLGPSPVHRLSFRGVKEHRPPA